MTRYSTPIQKPLLRWAGSKRKLLTNLLANSPPSFTRYLEPFAGSCCLFFALKPSKAILGDINAELIETYRVIREHPRLVARATSKLNTGPRSYYRIRSIPPASLSSVDRAARFVYLNRYCFNGVYRVNRKGEFNVPRGTKTGQVPNETDFYKCALLLRKATLRAADYSECLNDVSPGDFIYLDPPYAAPRRNTYGEYGYDCFTESQLPQLFRSLRRIDKCGATFLLSYCSHAILDSIPKHWNVTTIRVRRHVAGFARHRHLVKEMLISNRTLSHM